MLQTRNRLEISVSPDNVPPEFPSPFVSLADVVDFIRRRLSIIALTWGLALLYLIAAVPKFTAEAVHVIESKGTLGDTASVSTIVESQTEILSSDSIARAVIRKLDLAKETFSPYHDLQRLDPRTGAASVRDYL